MLTNLRSKWLPALLFASAALVVVAPPAYAGVCAETKYYIYQEGDRVCGQRWELSDEYTDPDGGSICTYDVVMTVCQ